MPREIIDIPLNGGLKEKVDERYLNPNDLVTATNAIWIAQNALEKRPGWLSGNTGKAISYPPSSTYPFTWGASSLSFGVALPQSGAGLSVSDGFYLYAQNSAQGTNEWLDAVSPCVATRRNVGSSTQSAFNPTVATWNGQTMYVWQDSGNFLGYADKLLFSIVDANGTTIREGVVGQVGRAPHLVVVGTWAVLICETGAAALQYATFNFLDTTGAWSTGHAFSAGGNVYSGGGVDVSGPVEVHGGAAFFAVSYTTGTGVVIAICSHTGSAVTIAVNTNTLVGTPTTFPVGCGISWDPVNSRMWVTQTYLDAGNHNVVAGLLLNVVWNGATYTITQAYALATLASYATGSVGIQTHQLGVVDISGGGNVAAVVVWEVGPASVGGFRAHVGWRALTGAGVATFAPGLAWATQLIGKPFAVNTPDAVYGCKAYALCATSETQQTQILCEFDVSGFAVMPRPVAVIAPRLAISFSSSSLTQMRGAISLSEVAPYSARAAGAYSIAGAISETSNVPANLAVLGVTCDFGHPARSKSVQLGRLTYVAGGIPSCFDGASCVESSTVTTIPTLATFLTAIATGGGLTNGQTYSYIFVPEWRDKLGNVAQGQPTAPFSVAVPAGAGAAGSVSGTIACLALSNKGMANRKAVFGESDLYLVPYRTLYLNGAMTTNYYRVVGDNPGSAYVNTPDTSQTLTFSDTQSDSNLETNPFIYTTGGVLEADCPSSFADVTTHAARIYGIGDDLRTIWVSTAQQDGIPCYFNDGAQTECSLIGDLACIWAQDDKLLVGNATGIAYVTGSGPNITGAQSDLSPWESVPTDVGPIDPRAICVTPLGTVFRHAYGLGLLDRSLQVHSEFGDPITQALAPAGGYTVTSIQIHPTRPEIHVFLNIANLGGGVAVYNYRFSAWSIYAISDPESFGASPTAAFVSGGNLTMLTALGRIWREKTSNDAKQFYDTANASDVWVPLNVTMGWVKLGGKMQGLGFAHRVQLTWVPQDWSDVTVTSASDYQDSVTVDTWAWPSTAVSAFATLGNPAVVDMHPMPKRRTAMQLSISDASPAGSPAAITGQGPRIVAVSCEVEPLEGPVRLSGAQRS
jgi:hypothetical protein